MPRPVKFFYDLLSTQSRALYMFFEATKIPYDPIPVCATKGENQTDKYKQALGKFEHVPSIIDDGFKLSNGVTILKYLIREKLIPDHWYPRSRRDRAQIDEYLEWHLDNHSKVLNAFVQPKQRSANQRTSEETLQEYRQLVTESLDHLERDWIAPGRFISGEKISIADILAACEVEQPKIVGLDPLEGRPKLAAWLEKVRYTMTPYYQEAHKDFYKLSKQKAVLRN
ncbi:glutathione S-transferase theta-2-like [Toxorhynchites rutilus septentrionalis]|uniref:glutathione S-transferase theta-2-like n=1 Tax=Toxorhynchites rutilus septentrionalis TaxID=329112 RepID=UPI002479B4EA|nr:glutathione S-transferase theta-2-like [Toxorhynchites rutilus septentrionalis]